jgi:hypothetical protein
VNDTRILCAVCGIWQCLARHGGGTCHAVNGPSDTSCGACYANRPTLKPDLTVAIASPLPEEPPTDVDWHSVALELNDIIERATEITNPAGSIRRLLERRPTLAALAAKYPASSERSRLAGENAALRKDAERIARLEALGRIRIYDPQSSEDAWEIRRDEWSAGDLLRSVTIGYGADLRDAIDDTAARLPADPGGRE